MHAIFLGDYFDDFYDTPAHMEVTCRWLKQAIGRGQDTFLLENHCFAYLSYELGVRWGYCSGWDVGKQQVFHRHFPGDTLLKSSAWTAHCQGWLISHAGLTRKLYRSFSKRNTSEEISKAKDLLKVTGAEDIASSGEKSVSTHGVDTDRQATDRNDTDRIRPSSVDSTRLEDERENRKVIGGR